ncbi:MAG: hypothetical protein LBI33_07005 [Propionibacteriaceae bacterium]|jgi:hypothetical protein|nr:hypothetical protein [Propionibacteriaceae bacterium]
MRRRILVLSLVSFVALAGVTGAPAAQGDGTAPAQIVGHVLSPDGSPVTWGTVYCYPTTGFFGNSSPGYVATTVASDGSYSCPVTPDSGDYVVKAYRSAYPTTWLGGHLGSVAALPADGVTVVTVGGAGETVNVQDITLPEGWSLFGRVTYEGSGYDADAVFACAYDADRVELDCGVTHVVGTDGSYTITGLIAGLSYTVYGASDGFVNSYHGDHIGYAGATVPVGARLVTGAAGDAVRGIDIALVKEAMATGRVDPDVVATAGGVTVYACPAFVGADGLGYYRTDSGHGTAPGSAAPAPNTLPASLPTTVTPTTPASAAVPVCASTSMSPGSDGSYTISPLVPGRDYVVIGVASGYVNAWYGGYLGDAKLNQRDVGGTSADQLLPARGVVLVNGDPGEVVPNVDLAFGPAVTRATDTTDVTDVTNEAPGTVASPTAPTGGTTSGPAAIGGPVVLSVLLVVLGLASPARAGVCRRQRVTETRFNNRPGSPRSALRPSRG